MISLKRITFGRDTGWYVCRACKRLDEPLTLDDDMRVAAFSERGKCDFYLLGGSRVIAKVKLDKYRFPRDFPRWFGRVLRDRILLQVDSRREFVGSNIYRQAGLRVVEPYGWCVAVNPVNRRGSIFFSQYRDDLISGRAWFDAASERDRLRLVEAVCNSAVSLAAHGYYSRDPHLNNLLVNESGDVYWLDTHLSPLPMRRGKCVDMVSSIQVRKIPGAEYQAYARGLLERGLRNLV